MRKLLDRSTTITPWTIVNLIGVEAAREYVKSENCGPDCEWCEPAVGIAICTQLDTVGDVYPDATDVYLRDGEWVVCAYDETAQFHRREVARYPQDAVKIIRNMPQHVRLYGHMVYDGPDIEGLD